MELGSGSWPGASKFRDPQTPVDTVPQEQGMVKSVTEEADKVPESSRATELSLEELSISSKQQQLQNQVNAAKGALTMATTPTPSTPLPSSPELALPQRPNRKRKLLDDVESGKTLLLDAYRVWQQGQKGMTYDLQRIEKIMSETYMLIKQVRKDASSVVISHLNMTWLFETRDTRLMFNHFHGEIPQLYEGKSKNSVTL